MRTHRFSLPVFRRLLLQCLMNPTFQIQKLTQFLHQKSALFSPHLLQIHAQFITTTNSSNLHSLFRLHASKSSYTTAIFSQTQDPSTLEWRHKISELASETNALEALSLFREMFERESQLDDPFVYASLIKACNKSHAIRRGKSVHSRVLRLGLDNSINVLNGLIHFYLDSAKRMSYARKLFDRMPDRTVVTINCMISGYMRTGFPGLGLDLFLELSRGKFGSNLQPNYVMLVILISGCVEFGGTSIGKSLHSYCHKKNLDANVEVCNVLIDFYTKSGCVNDAARLFNNTTRKDLVSWNSMITGYAKNNEAIKVFKLFKEMRNRNIGFDRVSLISLILVSANSKDIRTGKAIHGYIKGNGVNTTISLGISLINMYSKCGNLESAKGVFDELPKDDIGCWSSMIHRYVECGLNTEAFKLFNEIKSRELETNEVTMLGLVLACRNSGELNHGIHIHSHIKNCYNLNRSIVLGNALIDMYAKCGSTTRARAVLENMHRRDVISWTTLIVGYAINGQGEEALAAFSKMGIEKIEPNSVTFIGVLSACDHAGLVEKGRNLYNRMCNVYRIKPKIEHCGCIVDMHARAGMLVEAHQFVRTMPIEPNAIIWRMLMYACIIHGKIDLGLNLVNGIIELSTAHAAEDHVISANVLADAGKWDNVLFQRKLMVDHKAPKVAGKSSVSCLTENNL